MKFFRKFRINSIQRILLPNFVIIGFEITNLAGFPFVQSCPEELSNEIRPPVRPALAIQSELYPKPKLRLDIKVAHFLAIIS